MAKYVTATVEGFEDYHVARGRDIPASWTETAIDAALLVSSEWIDGTYGALFIGRKVNFLQDREWPRLSATTDTNPPYTFPDDTIPDAVTNAVYEAAYRQMTKPGSLLMDYTPGKYKRVSIDGALSVEYAGFTFASDAQSTFPIIDRLLIDLLDASASGNMSAFSGSVTRV